MDCRTVFAGDLEFMPLVNIFQIFIRSKRTGILRLTNYNTSMHGNIYFLCGNPINAICGPLVALDAVYEFFDWTEGRFEFNEEEIAVEKVIEENSMLIPFNAMQMPDERKTKKIGFSSYEKASLGESHGLQNDRNYS